MRIGIGGIRHETNSFSNVPTTVELFKQVAYHLDQELFEHYTGVRTPVGGFIDEAAVHAVELAPAFIANATPSGHITPETLDSLTTLLVDKLWEQHQAAPLDGILLSLHGAGVADGCDDIESYMEIAVRQRFGADFPLGVTLDLHANVTEEMVDNCTMLMGVKCYPHVDEYDNARDLLRHMYHHLRDGTPVYQKHIRLPWLLAPGGGVTISGPAHDVQQLLYKLEQENEDLLEATFFHGFPYADIPKAGVSIVTVAKTQAAADQAAQEIAQYAWSRRDDFTPVTLTPAEAMDQALQCPEGPVVINESSDNPGGGSPGDGTYLLSEMLKRNIPGSAFAAFWDPEVVKQAFAAGVGSRISCSLGAKADNLHGTPIELKDAYVKNLCDGKFVCMSPMGAGNVLNYGPTARLDVGNVSILVCTYRRQTFDCGPFEVSGIDYKKMRILGLKSSQHFKGWWYGKADIVTCDPPGIHCSDLTTFRFQNANTSYYPLSDATWE